jgi:hypothetical protein
MKIQKLENKIHFADGGANIGGLPCSTVEFFLGLIF